MSFPKIEDFISQADPEYLEKLARSLFRLGYGIPEGKDIATLDSEMSLRVAMREGPSAIRLERVLSSPQDSVMYAQFVEENPSDKTRTAACRSSSSAFEYASRVDKGPHPETRTSACRKPETAYSYFLYVDKGYHEETWEGVRGVRYYGEKYEEKCQELGVFFLKK